MFSIKRNEQTFLFRCFCVKFISQHFIIIILFESAVSAFLCVHSMWMLCVFLPAAIMYASQMRWIIILKLEIPFDFPYRNR